MRAQDKLAKHANRAPLSRGLSPFDPVCNTCGPTGKIPKNLNYSGPNYQGLSEAKAPYNWRPGNSVPASRRPRILQNTYLISR